VLNILILILATWRLSALLTDEAGPFDVFAHLRWLVGVRIDDVGQPYGANVLACGLLCLRCTSVWIGASWAVLYYIWPDMAFWLALPFALSAGAISMNEVINGES
jgi:hypothetical protein